MDENWNVFEHSAENNPPEESEDWVRTRMLDSVDIHVWPPNDGDAHIFESSCVCAPVIETEKRDGLVIARAIVHNAWDGRLGPFPLE
jgi:hypothetical protein